MFKGEAEGRGKNQSSPIRWGVGLRKLTSNEGGGGVIRIQRSLKGSGKFHRGKTIILPPPLLVNSVSNMTKL